MSVRKGLLFHLFYLLVAEIKTIYSVNFPFNFSTSYHYVRHSLLTNKSQMMTFVCHRCPLFHVTQLKSFYRIMQNLIFEKDIKQIRLCGDDIVYKTTCILKYFLLKQKLADSQAIRLKLPKVCIQTLVR